MPSMPLCLFTGRIEDRDGDYVVTIPEQELDVGSLEAEETYRVGVYPERSTTPETTDQQSSSAVEQAHTSRPAPEQPTTSASRDSARPESPGAGSSNETAQDQPPVTEGETLQVQIDDLGEQGDGIARVGPGYIVFVPDTEVGQQPRVRITSVRGNFAFAEVLDE